MTGLPSKTFAQFTQAMVSGWASSLGFPPTFQEGDAFYALMETVSAQLVFIQAQIQLVNDIARAQTSSGADLDTFYAQFGFYRIGGTLASGQVTFASFSPATSSVLIPASNPAAMPPTQGVIVQTQGGAIQYQVVADPTQPTWNASQNGYILAPGQSSLVATVQALLPGSAYNVTTGQLSQIGTSLAGIDTVTNAAAITNGTDAEPDATFRVRFVLFINSLSKATYGAITSAVFGIAGVSSAAIVENVNVGGYAQPGEFIATIDNGTGVPPASLVTAVQNALETVRGFTILAVAQAVTQTSVTELITVRTDPSFTQSVVNAAVQVALQTATNSLGIGAILYISALEQAAMSVPGVISVQPGTKINGTNADLTVNQFKRAFVPINSVVVDNY